MQKVFYLLIIIVLFIAEPTSAQNISHYEPDPTPRNISVAVNYGYQIRLPDNYEEGSSQTYPLMIFLHGSGERGTEIEKVNVHGPYKYADTTSSEEFPFILLSPQCPSPERWNAARLDLLIDQIVESYPVDTQRIYLTGLSMGAFGTWDLIFYHPDRFAAVAAVCGGDFTHSRESHIIQDIPIWIFHGALDNVVPVGNSTRIAESLKRQNHQHLKFTIYPFANHDSWTETYANPDLYKWFLSHHK